MNIFFIIVVVVDLLGEFTSKGYFELTEELGCHDTEFRLSCEQPNAKIAIFEATFSKNDTFLDPLHSSCENPGHPTNISNWKLFNLKEWQINGFAQKKGPNDAVEINFRYTINRRCSGQNYCTFVLKEDFELASTIGPGAVYLRYACVEDTNTVKACNTIVDASFEGFIKTPGYPEYYIGERLCQWSLRASSLSQKVRVTFLDVSIRGIAPHEKDCLDWIIVSEDGLNITATCGDVWEDMVILSDGPVLNVTFQANSKTVFPKRGILFHYKAVGCPALRKPEDGYLIADNGSFAHFRCCIGFVFPDTLTRDKTLQCYNENTWDGEISDCINETKLIESNWNSSFNKNFSWILKADTSTTMESSDTIKDVLLPCVIMCILFIGNGIVLYFIHRQRKKQESIEKVELMEFSKRNA